MFQVQPVRRHRRRNLLIVVCVEQSSDYRQLPFPGCGVEHRANEESNHMMHESIRCHEKRESSGPFDPLGAPNDASVIVGLGSGALYGESAKASFPDDHSRGLVENCPVDWTVPGKLAPGTERALCIFVSSHQISIRPRKGVEPGVKALMHVIRPRHSHVSRQDCVQRALEIGCRPLRRHVDTGRLAERVNSGVGSACAEDGDTGPAKALHRVFEHSLNRPLIGLTLPACEVRSVILKNELQRSRLHCANYRSGVVAANSSYMGCSRFCGECGRRIVKA